MHSIGSNLFSSRCLLTPLLLNPFPPLSRPEMIDFFVETTEPALINPTPSIPSPAGQPILLKIRDAPGIIQMPIQKDIIGAAQTPYDATNTKRINITKQHRIKK